MFGKSFLVAPVTEAGAREWPVYLPKPVKWYDFWTGRRYDGGQTVKTASPQDRLPLFVKAGSIVPMGKFIQHTSEKPRDTLEVRIYPGADGKFTLYSDEGDNYNYEKGKYTEIAFDWNDQQQMLTIGKQQGSYAGALKKQVFNLVWTDEGTGVGTGLSPKAKTIIYTGQKKSVKRN